MLYSLRTELLLGFQIQVRKQECGIHNLPLPVGMGSQARLWLSKLGVDTV
jgi:hypothetical protein